MIISRAGHYIISGESINTETGKKDGGKFSDVICVVDIKGELIVDYGVGVGSVAVNELRCDLTIEPA